MELEQVLQRVLECAPHHVSYADAPEEGKVSTITKASSQLSWPWPTPTTGIYWWALVTVDPVWKARYYRIVISERKK